MKWFDLFLDEEGNILATPLLTLPSRKKHPDYFQVIKEPIDLNTIRNNIKRGYYADLQTVDADFSRLFKNVEVQWNRLVLFPFLLDNPI